MKHLQIFAALFCAACLAACSNGITADTVGTHAVSEPSPISDEAQLFSVEGRYLRGKVGHMMILDGTPFVIADRDSELDFSSLTDGDLIRITTDGLRETYPGQLTAYSLEKLSNGERSDIDESLIDHMIALGWLEKAPADSTDAIGEGRISVNTVTLPLTSENTRIASHPFDGRYTLYITCDFEQNKAKNVKLYIVDALEGAIAFEAELDTDHLPDTVSYELPNMCKLYSKKDVSTGSRDTYNVYTVVKNDTFRLIKGELSASAPIFGMPQTSPDGKYTAYEVTDDEAGHGGITVLADGKFTRILENIIYDGESVTDIGEVRRYVPVGFIDDTRLAYKLIAWEGSGGYGFYDMASGEKLEVRDGNYTPMKVHNGSLIAMYRGYYDDIGSFESVVEITPGLTEKLIASHQNVWGAYMLPEGAGCRLGDELWLCYERTVTEDGFYIYRDIIVYTPYFKEKLAELTAPESESEDFVPRLHLYGTSLTFTVPEYSPAD